MRCRQTVAIDLPQKALIWASEKGDVWITYNDPGYLQRRHGVPGCEPVFAKVAMALRGISEAAANP
jgi:uncharacterized protein (DUF302 family)